MAGRVPGPSSRLALHLGTCVRPLPGEQWRGREAEVDAAALGVDGEGQGPPPQLRAPRLWACRRTVWELSETLPPLTLTSRSPARVHEAPDSACLPSPACLAPDIGPVAPALDLSPRPAAAELPGPGGGAWQAS